MTRILSVFNLLKRVGFAFLFLLGAGKIALTQPPQIIWTEIIGDSGDYQATDACLTNNDVVAFVGSYSSSLTGDRVIMSGAVSAAGDCLWTRTYDTLTYAIASSILEASNSLYVIGSRFDSLENWNQDALFCHMNQNGALSESHLIGGERTEQARSAVLSENNGIALCGYRNTGGLGADLYLAKADSSGHVTWERGYRPSPNAFTQGTDIVALSSGGYAALGFFRTDGFNSSQLYLVRMNDQGDTLWTRTYGQPDVVDESAALHETDDGGFVIAWNSAPPGFSFCEIRLLRGNSNGAVLWEQVLPLPRVRNPFVNSVLPAQNGGWLVGGTILSEDLLEYDLLLAGVGENGGGFWYTTYDTDGDGSIGRVLDAGGDGYYLLGQSLNFESSQHAVFVYYVSRESLSIVDPPTPQDLAILRCYPNPFNSEITLQVTLADRESVTLEIFDFLGRHVRTIANGVQLEAGNHTFSYSSGWQATGSYICKLTTSQIKLSQKILLVK